MARAKRNEAEMLDARNRKDFAKIQELLKQQMEHFPEMLNANARAMPKTNDTSLK